MPSWRYSSPYHNFGVQGLSQSGEMEIQFLTCLFQVNEWRIPIFHGNIFTYPDSGIIGHRICSWVNWRSRARSTQICYRAPLNITVLICTMARLKIFTLWCLSGSNRFIYIERICKLLSFKPICNVFFQYLALGLVYSKQLFERWSTFPPIHHICIIFNVSSWRVEGGVGQG